MANNTDNPLRGNPDALPGSWITSMLVENKLSKMRECVDKSKPIEDVGG